MPSGVLAMIVSVNVNPCDILKETPLVLPFPTWPRRRRRKVRSFYRFNVIKMKFILI